MLPLGCLQHVENTFNHGRLHIFTLEPLTNVNDLVDAGGAYLIQEPKRGRTEIGQVLTRKRHLFS